MADYYTSAQGGLTDAQGTAVPFSAGGLPEGSRYFNTLPPATPVNEPTSEQLANRQKAVLSSEPAREKTKNSMNELKSIEEGLLRLRESVAEKPKADAPAQSSTESIWRTPDGEERVIGDADMNKSQIQQGGWTFVGGQKPRFLSEQQPEYRIEQANQNLDSQLQDEIIKPLDAIRSQMNQANQALIQSIQTQYATRKTQMEQANKQSLETLRVLGFKSGRAEYAPEIQTSILSSEERQGIQRLAELDSEEKSLIAQAQLAASKQDYEMLTKKMDLVQKARKDQVDQVNKLRELAIEEEKNAAAKIKASQDAQKQQIETLEKGRTAYAKALVNSPYADDPDFVAHIADLYGDSPELLMGEVNALAQDAKRKDAQLIGTDMRDYEYMKSSGQIDSSMTFRQWREIYKKPIPTPKTTTPTSIIPGLKSVPGAKPVSSDVSQAIALAVRGLKFPSVTDRKDAEETLQQLVSAGDIPNAKEQLMSYVRNSLSGPQSDVVLAYDQGLENLKIIEQSLAAYEKAGGKTDIFRGLMTKAQNKLGIADVNAVTKQAGTSLSKIANDIALAIIAYRRAVSGAAFTESEGRQYADVFPSIANTKQLNTAKIASLRQSFGTNRETFYKAKIGASKYDKIFGDTDQYKQFRSQLKTGEILVNRNGIATAVTTKELLPTDIKL